MERLRIELCGESLDPLLINWQPAGAKSLAYLRVFEISPGHRRHLLRKKRRAPVVPVQNSQAAD
jgi:hypothetical protein